MLGFDSRRRETMTTFQVKLMPDGEYEKIDGGSAKEAAEGKYGRPLSEIGSMHELRVMVHPMIWPRGNPILFYDRA